MPIEITMPKLSDTMAEGTILKWHVAAGDRVRRGDIIAEVETDKAAMEMEAFEDGTVSDLKVAEGETVEVGAVIAVLDAGETGDSGLEADKKTKAKAEKTEKDAAKESEVVGEDDRESTREEPTEPEKKEPEKSSKKEPEEPSGKEPEPPSRRMTHPGGERLPVSPAARRLAESRGVDLSRVRGTGPGGRIVVADVEKGAVSRSSDRSEPASEKGASGEKPQGKSVKIRRIIARKMVEAWETIPHFYVTVAVDMTDIIRFRKDLGVSINDFIVAATARSLLEHPWVNSHFQDGEAQEQPEVNIAMAVATERGLYNPVLHDCAGRSLKELSRMTAALAERAHQGKLAQEDLTGGTFTISNMGMLGVESFSAIITPPQAAVLAVGTARGELVVDEHGETTIAPILRLTLSADHRVIDGADAAEFLGTLKSYLEAPVVLIAGEGGKERD